MRTLIGFCLVLVLVVGLNTAQATTLLTTPSALPGWQGSQDYNGALLGDTLDVTVEFAVFAPGDFQNFLDENGIVYSDPTPSELIYAYQIVDIALGSTSVTTISIGLDGDEAFGSSGVLFVPSATNYGTYPLQPATDPAGTAGGPGGGMTSAAWQTTSTPIPAGQVSPILFYSSPQLPELGLATLNAGWAGQFLADSMPNPAIPEPATLVLCVLAGLSLISRRRL